MGVSRTCGKSLQSKAFEMIGEFAQTGLTNYEKTVAMREFSPYKQMDTTGNGHGKQKELSRKESEQIVGGSDTRYAVITENKAMENKLKKLFEYQRFERNERLEKLILETESGSAKGLTDDELFLVNAAGEPKADMIRGGSTPRKEKQVGGITGCCDTGTVTGYNIGGITGDFVGSYADDNE